MKKLETQAWWPKLVAKKDDLSLRQLSEEFGVSPAAISNALKRNKLTRKAAPSGPRKKGKAAASTSTAKTAPKAAKRKKTRTPVQAAAAKPAPKAARRTKTPRRGKTPASAAAKPTKRARRTRRSTLSRYRSQMGKVVDREIAEKAGVTVSAVTNYRRRHNIPARSGRGRPRSTPAVVAAKTPVKKTGAPKVRSVAARGSQLAFRVVIGKTKVIVVAKDIAAAAQLAQSVGKGPVSRIRLLGPALV